MRRAIATHRRSPLPISLALAHAIVFLLIVFSEAPLPPPSEPCQDPTGEGCGMDVYWGTFGIRVMGREFHHDRAFKMLSMIDLPALLVGGGLWSAANLVGTKFSVVTGTYVDGWLQLVVGTFQWWMVGVLATARRRSRKGNERGHGETE